jgi:hypothetical protein
MTEENNPELQLPAELRQARSFTLWADLLELLLQYFKVLNFIPAFRFESRYTADITNIASCSTCLYFIFQAICKKIFIEISHFMLMNINLKALNPNIRVPFLEYQRSFLSLWRGDTENTCSYCFGEVRRTLFIKCLQMTPTSRFEEGWKCIYVFLR